MSNVSLLSSQSPQKTRVLSVGEWIYISPFTAPLIKLHMLN